MTGLPVPLGVGRTLAPGHAQLARELPTDLRTLDDVAHYRRVSAARGTTAAAHTAAFGLTSREIRAGGCDVTVFAPRDLAAPAARVVFLHGGGLVAGTRFDGPDTILRHASALGLEVWSVEYPLAPESSFDDMVDAAALAVRAAASDGLRVLLAGQSAGGGVAAATALACRDGDARPDGLMLICPMLSPREAPSAVQCADDPSWSAQSNATAWRVALGDRPRRRPPGEEHDLRGMPPTFLDAGAVEVFRDHIVSFASRLCVAGCAAELHIWSGAFHASDGVVADAPVSLEAHDARGRWLRRWLDGDLGD